MSPRPISFLQAGALAVLGLIVNLVSAVLLHHDHAHDHDDDHDHDHDHGHHHDTNLRAAYLHVIADAFTSVLAVLGLLAGALLGWIWMDALIGVVGAIVIAYWAIGLSRTAAHSLLDSHDDSRLEATVRALIDAEGSGARVQDLHLWRLGPGHHGLVLSLSSSAPHPPEYYKRLLADLPSLGHVTVEINPA